jgi:colanic acid/amylovoran biosynthesis glycosyltransferase
MKILFFISSFPAISETFILNQITGMIDLGYQVEILATKKVETQQVHPEIESYDLMNKVTYVDIPASVLKKTIKSGQTFGRTFVNSPARAVGLMNFMKEGKFVWSLRPLLVNQYFEENRNFDAIISHYGYNTLLLEIIKHQYSDFPKIYGFFHGNDVTGFVQRFGENIYKPLKGNTDTHGLPISELMKERLQRLNILSDNINVHHMGVDMDKFKVAPYRKFSLPIHLLMVGRLTEKKGMDTAILAVKKLRDQGTILKLTIIGDGEKKAELTKMISRYQLEDQICLLGAQNQSTVQKMLQQANIVLLPSKTAANGDKEGIPVSLMEALASGKLVISTYHSGIPELITNDYNGWLVPENDSNALAEKISYVMALTENRRIKVSEQAVKSIDQSFNIEKLNGQLGHLIDK